MPEAIQTSFASERPDARNVCWLSGSTRPKPPGMVRYPDGWATANIRIPTWAPTRPSGPPLGVTENDANG